MARTLYVGYRSNPLDTSTRIGCDKRTAGAGADLSDLALRLNATTAAMPGCGSVERRIYKCTTIHPIAGFVEAGLQR